MDKIRIILTLLHQKVNFSSRGGSLKQQYQADPVFACAKRSDFIAMLSPISCHGQYLYLHAFLYLYFYSSFFLHTPLASLWFEPNGDCCDDTLSIEVGFGDMVPSRSFLGYEESLFGKMQVIHA